ncbi:MAG: ArsI/CadI family heavy metal resistance metalloenzyme [Pseudomonadota bacterium]
MKRLHIHVAVEDLDSSIIFYNSLFGAMPSKTKTDYAKWMLDDPRINFAISTRSGKTGIDHLGLQVDEFEELETLRERASAADMSVVNEGEIECCYARADKSWVTDPSGVAWEVFKTMADVQRFGDAPPAALSASLQPGDTEQKTSIQGENAGVNCCG